MGITHTKVATIADDPNAEVGSDEWNADHVGVFDATVPVTQAHGDAAATGSAAVAARRDHVHGMPVAPLDLWVGAPNPGVGTTSGTLAANAAYLICFQVFRAVTVSNTIIKVATQSGNIDVGIYSSDGTTATRLGSTGSIACPAVSVRSVNALTAGVDLVPGTRYFAAFAADNATASLGIVTGLTPMVNPATYGGSIATSFPLPATITQASLATGSRPIILFE